jgi:hypothetical protein
LDIWASTFVSTSCGEVAAVEGLFRILEMMETLLRVLLELLRLLTLAVLDGIRRVSGLVEAAGGAVYR